MPNRHIRQTSPLASSKHESILVDFRGNVRPVTQNKLGFASQPTVRRRRTVDDDAGKLLTRKHELPHHALRLGTGTPYIMQQRRRGCYCPHGEHADVRLVLPNLRTRSSLSWPFCNENIPERLRGWHTMRSPRMSIVDPGPGANHSIHWCIAQSSCHHEIQLPCNAMRCIVGCLAPRAGSERE